VRPARLREDAAMTAFDLASWHDLFVMAGGASAALAGLLFVAVSLNLEHILKYSPLPTMAAQSVALLIGLVVLSAFVLAPGQPVGAVGVETLALGCLLLVVLVVPTLRHRSAGDKRIWLARRLILALVAIVPMIGGAISLLAGSGGGMFWMLAEVVTGLAAATYNAWVLLIEIRR
jgi:hypothetical protein